jgi:6-phosphogluconolactonase (cycloisomerase 2 family)
MKAEVRSCFTLAVVVVLAALPGIGQPSHTVQTKRVPQPPIYVISNDDQQFPYGNQSSVYLAGGSDASPVLTYQTTIMTGGYGSLGGFFASSRLSSAADVAAKCLYVSNSGDNTISSVALDTLQLVATFSGSATDSGTPQGIGLATYGNYLYAGYTTSKTIGVFATTPGCGLTFLQDVAAVGLHGGSVVGMAVNSKVLVVTYGDGSIQSFNVSSGIPVANNDLQNSTAYSGLVSSNSLTMANLPSGVDITSDGKFAIFGDISSPAVVEVSSLAGGTLHRTTPYVVGTGVDAGTLRLSPDQKLLYLVNNEGGTVSAAFFDAKTGIITPGCMSAPLRDFNSRAWFGGLATRDTTGTGTVLYVAEFGRFTEILNPPSAVGILTITSDGKTCKLTEAPGSPQLLTFPGTLSIGAYPPRPF